MHQKLCAMCGKSFTCSRIEKQYCSEACYKKAEYAKLHPKESIVCKHCGRVFVPNRSDQVYCNVACQKKHSDNAYKDTVRFGGNRSIALKRDHYKCVMCGKDKNLVLHHIDNSGQTNTPNNALDNLQTLCDACHSAVHDLHRPRTYARERAVCMYCGKAFDTVHGKANKYCSRDCVDKAHAGMSKTAYVSNCIICGKPFNTTPYKVSIGKGKYCSHECSAIGQRGVSKYKPITKQITVKCQHCGNEFATTQVRLDDGRGKFCSKACMYASFEGKHPEGKPRSRVYLKCISCNKDFWVTQSALDSGRGKYCSRNCYNTARK